MTRLAPRASLHTRRPAPASVRMAVLLGALLLLAASPLHAAWPRAFLDTAQITATKFYIKKNTPPAADERFVYVAGTFSGTLKLQLRNEQDPTKPTPLNLNPIGRRDLFVAKLNDDGEILWATTAGSALDETVAAIDVDAAGNVYLTGGFCGGTQPTSFPGQPVGRYAPYTITPGCGAQFTTSLIIGNGSTFLPSDLLGRFSPAGATWCNGAVSDRRVNFADWQQELYAAKLSEKGEWLWALPAGGNLSDAGTDIIAVPGGAVVAGTYRGIAQVGGVQINSASRRTAPRHLKYCSPELPEFACDNLGGSAGAYATSDDPGACYAGNFVARISELDPTSPEWTTGTSNAPTMNWDPASLRDSSGPARLAKSAPDNMGNSRIYTVGIGREIQQISTSRMSGVSLPTRSLALDTTRAAGIAVTTGAMDVDTAYVLDVSATVSTNGQPVPPTRCIATPYRQAQMGSFAKLPEASIVNALGNGLGEFACGAITTDEFDGVYIAGEYLGQISLERAGAMGVTSQFWQFGWNLFIAKLVPSGWEWVLNSLTYDVSGGAYATARARAIAADGFDLALGGSFGATVQFGGAHDPERTGGHPRVDRPGSAEEGGVVARAVTSGEWPGDLGWVVGQAIAPPAQADGTQQPAADPVYFHWSAKNRQLYPLRAFAAQSVRWSKAGGLPGERLQPITSAARWPDDPTRHYLGDEAAPVEVELEGAKYCGAGDRFKSCIADANCGTFGGGVEQRCLSRKEKRCAGPGPKQDVKCDSDGACGASAPCRRPESAYDAKDVLFSEISPKPTLTAPGQPPPRRFEVSAGSQPGYSVLLHTDDDPGVPAGERLPDVLEVVYSAPITPNVVTNCRIGRELLPPPTHSFPAGRSGWVVNEAARYNPNLYDRETRSGRIFPVNTVGATGKDLTVAWYERNRRGISWPSLATRYDCTWGTPDDTIVIENGLGVVLVDSSGRVYGQNDPAQPGFNPNEEHALILPSKTGGTTAVFALRNDLNGAYGHSEPYVLVEYPAAASMAVFAITHAAASSEAQVTVGTELERPYPLSEIGACASTCSPSAEECAATPRTTPCPALCGASPYSAALFRDADQNLWARAPGRIGVNYDYPLDDALTMNAPNVPFFYGGPAPRPACMPWYTDSGTRQEFVYRAAWPANPPTLLVGETLTRGKAGADGGTLPDLLTANAAQVVFETRAAGAPQPANEPGKLARLIDFRSVRSVAGVGALPDLVQDPLGGIRKGVLPPSLERRLSYSSSGGGILSFRGEIIPAGTGGQSGDTFVLPNVMTDAEKAELLRRADGAWSGLETLFTRTNTPPGMTELGLRSVDGRPEGVKLTERGSMGLSAGRAEGAGYLTLAINDTPDSTDRRLEVIEVGCGPGFGTTPQSTYQGQLQVLQSGNVFADEVTVRYNADFGANDSAPPVFEWWYAVKEQDCEQTGLPPATGWRRLAGETGPEIVIGGRGSDDMARAASLGDLCVAARYTGYSACGNAALPSQWAGEAISTTRLNSPQARLVDGWLARIVQRINFFDARLNDFRQPGTGGAVATWPGALQTAGARFEGPISLTPETAADSSVKLIDLYETVLQRAREKSIDDTPPLSVDGVNSKLLDVAGRLAGIYMMYGNEAYSDALDPTIGFSTTNADPLRRSVQPNGWAFFGQASSLLEEELVLLRGREGAQARPHYNRYKPNFNSDPIGTTYYQQNYAIRDPVGKGDGFIDASDADLLYPQGHGDAWGHYLTAIKQYYRLLRDPQFHWLARSDSVNISGGEVQVDFTDERRFAEAAAARARTGAEIVDLTYRRYWEDDPAGQAGGYRDTTAPRGENDDGLDPRYRRQAFGVIDWAQRAALGAYFDWVTANALLPPLSGKPPGIQRIDRRTVPELGEIVSQAQSVVYQTDLADAGVNPLGVAKNVVPFDISPALLTDGVFGKTHYEQVAARAGTALSSAVAAFDYANGFTQLLRQRQDDSDKFAKDVAAEERDYNNKLIAIFGTPYREDIGDGGTYPDGYAGPDVINWDVADASELTGGAPGEVEGIRVCVAGANRGDFCSSDVDCVDCDAESCPGRAGEKGDCDISSDVTNVVISVSVPEYEDCTGPQSPSCTDNRANAGCTCKFDPKSKLKTGSGGKVVTSPAETTIRVSNLGFGKVKQQGWTMRDSPGELQLARSDVLQARAELERVLKAYRALVGDIDCTLGTIRGQNRLADQRMTLNNEITGTLIGMQSVILAAKAAELVMRQMAETTIELAEGGAECLPKSVGTSTDATAPARCGIILGGVIGATAWDKGADAAVGVQLAADFAQQVQARINEMKIQGLEDDFEIYNLLGTLGERVRQEPVLRLEAFTLAERARQAGVRLQMKLAEGLRLWDQLATYRRQTAAEVAEARYSDYAFRSFRNDALQKYRAQFDMAARYVYLAAAAFDYETNLLGSDTRSGRAFLTNITRQRSLGTFSTTTNGTGETVFLPQRGTGLGSVLRDMNDSYARYKTDIGINRPGNQVTPFSLRKELFRLLEGSDAAWRRRLIDARVADLRNVPEFRRFARPPQGQARGPIPGLVIRFPTSIVADQNFFGWPSTEVDSTYNSSVFATRVLNIGVWFQNYTALVRTPKVYVIPAGADVLRAKTADESSRTREWTVLDQRIPQPDLLAPQTIATIQPRDWTPFDLLGGESFGSIRKWASFEGFHAGSYQSAHFDGSSRAVGRSVWNTNWVLMIAGIDLLGSNPEEGLNRFIYGNQVPGGGRILDPTGKPRDGNGVSDIELYFSTYSYDGA